MSSYNIFVASDHHFNHSNILTFKRDDGSPVRDFSSVEEMNEVMIDRHNKVVRPQDKIYMLGDVAFTNTGIKFLERMNGTKILIKGNHDTLKMSVYEKYFKDIRGTHSPTKGIVFSHVPLHPDSLSRWGVNVHGHLHTNKVQLNCGEDWSGDTVYVEDNRYFCACVEQIDFTPIALEEIKSILSKRK